MNKMRAEIVQLAAAHVSAGRGSEEANRLAVQQHAHLCGLLAEEQPVQPRKARSLHRRVRQIADELLSLNYGHPSQEMGDRLAIKKQYGDAERDLGAHLVHRFPFFLHFSFLGRPPSLPFSRLAAAFFALLIRPRACAALFIFRSLPSRQRHRVSLPPSCPGGR